VIGVVVLSFNKRAQLIEALASIERADYPDLVTVVFDNASSDGSVEAARARFRHFTIIANPENLGAPGGRNAGRRHLGRLADCDIVVFLDDDAEVTPSYFRRIEDCFAANHWAGVVAGKTLTGPGSGVIMSAGIKVNFYTGNISDIGTGEKDRGQYDKPREIDACGGFTLAVRAKVFDQLGGIDEAFNPYGWEDVDFCLRARKAGYKVLYEPRAVMCHKGTRAGRPLKAEYEQHEVRNYFRLLGRHANLAQKATCFFFVPLRMSRVAWLMIRTGHAGVILSQARGFFDGLRGPSR